MSADVPDTRSDRLSWELSPADVRFGWLLVYLPVAFLGGHVGLLLVTAVALVPAMLADPRLLALAALLVLVGGPFSLLYLWPMLRNPDQRPDPGRHGWLDHVSVCWLSYVDDTAVFGKPHLVGAPGSLADEVLAVLRAGVDTDPDVAGREADPVARAVLGGVAVLFLGTALTAMALVGGPARLFVAGVTGALGGLFVAAAYYIA
jgi:hypothetical protein